MSISNFVSAGIMFHNYGKTDVSLSLISSALDATAKKVFPNQKNSQRIKNFIRKYMYIVTNFGFPGISATAIRIKCIDVPNLKPDDEGYVGIEDIIYHTIRCGLIHECDIEKHIEFTVNTELGDFNKVFKIPYQLFWGLALPIIICKENADEKTEDNVKINLCGKDFWIQELWGKEEDLQKLIADSRPSQNG